MFAGIIDSEYSDHKLIQRFVHTNWKRVQFSIGLRIMLIFKWRFVFLSPNIQERKGRVQEDTEGPTWMANEQHYIL